MSGDGDGWRWRGFPGTLKSLEGVQRPTASVKLGKDTAVVHPRNQARTNSIMGITRDRPHIKGITYGRSCVMGMTKVGSRMYYIMGMTLMFQKCQGQHGHDVLISSLSNCEQWVCNT